MEGGFMIGLPYETQSSWRTTVDWLKQADCPLDISTCYPVNIVKKSERNKWFPTSWFDNNYETFGYEFPHDGIEGMLSWEKHDDTDINSFIQAQQIADVATKELETYQRQRRGDFYTSSFNHPLLGDRERTLDMSQTDYNKMISTVDFNQLYFDQVNEYYFKKLLGKLRGKNV
jgi:hypothetical protein